MLTIHNLSFYFGSRLLYENVNLHIRPKERIALIGANGTGKSTLLRLITKEYTPDEGSIAYSNDCTIGFLNQDLLSYQSTQSIRAVAMEAFERQNALQADINRILKKLETDYTDKLVEQLSTLQEEFAMLDGYSLQSKAEEILEGLGFRTADLERPLQEFSGGWRMRVMLAKLLLQKPSLLLLDEPTNHLDMPSIQWLENYLNHYEGAVIVVSHDRHFLEKCTNITVEVSGQQMHYYAGNYSFYLEERELRREIQQAAYENQQAKIRQTERFIERFRAKASKSRQVQSRVKALDRLDRIDEVIDENATVYFKFNFGRQSGRDVLQLKDISKSFGDLKILDNAQGRIERGDKIALIGANGKGKSTLLRIIAGTEPISGERIVGHNVNTAFYAQHQLESLNVENEILEELKQSGSGKTDTELRSVLGCFLFKDEEVFKKIKVLSGGEKSRVALAKMLIEEANFLLLDEPTNHLDMQSVNILIQALNQYEGTYVVVSHDRYFVQHVANKIWYIEDHQLKEYPGTFAEYNQWQAERETQLGASPANAPTPAAPKPEPKPKPTANTEQQKAIKNDLRKLKQQLSDAEVHIETLESAKNEYEHAMADPSVYQDGSQMQDFQTRYQATLQALEKAHQNWERIAEQIDSLEAQL
ncbi:ribosomal protection-like ABC-F family protein [Eisenibacter elegans]|uniref:ribosomal protection-like ABC-F family protein n=1 Tax=Eisenibacter elegans TaxID=997 RepID=UPI000423571B|nr:ABC-F family ATP-binding cassette domain-containing protein [Eisenibacter elegans]